MWTSRRYRAASISDASPTRGTASGGTTASPDASVHCSANADTEPAGHGTQLEAPVDHLYTRAFLGGQPVSISPPHVPLTLSRIPVSRNSPLVKPNTRPSGRQHCTSVHLRRATATRVCRARPDPGHCPGHRHLRRIALPGHSNCCPSVPIPLPGPLKLGSSSPLSGPIT